jgi:hypothetical protein
MEHVVRHQHGFSVLNASSVNQPLEWNTSSVTDMRWMFGTATSFNQPLHWDTSSVTIMAGMFHKATSFNQTLKWDTSFVTSMAGMFESATSFRSAAGMGHIACQRHVVDVLWRLRVEGE